MILIVESYPNLASIMATYLRSKGISARSASSFEEGIQIAKANKVTCLVAEHKTGDMDGRSLTEEILKFHPNAQTIITTSSLNTLALKKVLPEKTSIIVKPFTPVQLIQLIQDANTSIETAV